MFLSNLTELTISQGSRRFCKLVPALSEELRAEIYRLRHEGFGRASGFEPLAALALEVSAFDAQSVHCPVQSVSIGLFLGCGRRALTDALEAVGENAPRATNRSLS